MHQNRAIYTGPFDKIPMGEDGKYHKIQQKHKCPFCYEIECQCEENLKKKKLL